MKVQNAVLPTEAQIVGLMNSDVEGPVVMVNLLKFRDQAEYADGREDNISGVEAYMRYGVEMRKIVEGGGGRFVFSGVVGNLMIGEVEELWDVVAIVEYPSRQGFIEMLSKPEVQEIGVHRAAGLAGQLLIQTSET